MSAKYYVYRNLHTKTFSLKYKGIVVKHPECVKLHKVKMHVSEVGRKRVLKEKRKNVHATVSGESYTLCTECDLTGYEPVFYDPYKVSTFVDQHNKKVTEAEEAICINNKVYIKRK